MTEIGYITTSHSIDGTFESCARRFEFLHSYQRAPDYESDAFAADVGTALHEAIQEWQRKLFYGVDDEKARESAYLMLLKWWPWATEERRFVNKRATGNRRLETAILLLEETMNYNEFWEQWELVSIDGFGPAIEVPWRIVHKSIGVIKDAWDKSVYLATQGKIDLLMRHRTTRQYRVIDIKTTEKALPAHDAAFRFSGQGGQYAMVLGHAVGTDWETNGLDVTYLIMFFSDDGPVVYPLPYHLDPEEIEDSIRVKIERLNRMKSYADADHWPRRTHGCEFYGTPCGFLDICHRRDKPFVREWFEFEIAADRFKHYARIYDPVWTMEA